MTTIEQFITPGLDDVRAGYDHLRALGVDASAAADWLTDHVRTVARDDLAAQMERAQAQFVADGSTDTEHRRMRRALQTAVKIYNRHRHRLTAFDVETGYVVTTAGAAAVNRAAVVREIKAPQEAPAILGRANAQAITGPRGNVKAFEVAGRLHVPAVGLRAFVATFKAGSRPGQAEASVRLHDFQVIH